MSWVVGIVAMLGTAGTGFAQSSSAAQPGNTYEGGLGKQGGNPAAAPGSSTPTQVSTPLTTDERHFLLEVAQADVFQMDAASLAAGKSTSPRVKALAQSVLDSHARIRMWLQQIATERGITLPSEPDARQSAQLASLRRASGAAFDREYTRAALEENRRDLRRFEQAEASTAEDRRIRTFAQAQLPALEKNVREARATADAQRG